MLPGGILLSKKKILSVQKNVDGTKQVIIALSEH
jgi:hypothetical protein